MRIYVAGASAEREAVRSYVAKLEAAGFTVTLDWTKVVDEVVAAGGDANRGLTPERRKQQALLSCDAVETADVFWLIVPKGSSAGAWFELAVAVFGATPDAGREIVVSGDVDKSIFTALADHCFPSHDDAMAAILGLTLTQPNERPKCTGEWVGGSGGHRQHRPCGKDADWWHPEDPYAYCDDHIRPHDRPTYRRWAR